MVISTFSYFRTRFFEKKSMKYKKIRFCDLSKDYLLQEKGRPDNDKAMQKFQIIILRFLQKAPIRIPSPLPEYIERVKEIKKSEGNCGELFCATCGLYLNSEQQLKSHVKSTKHKMVELGLIDKKSDNSRKRDVVRKMLGFNKSITPTFSGQGSPQQGPL